MPDYSPPPPLALSDIIHTMSPSPGPSTQQDSLQSSADELDPFNRTSIAELRQRLLDVSDMSSREKELADMVLRLTDSPLPDPSQLVVQAEAISSLLAERNYLLQCHADERSRWASERDGWNRMAEALIAQRARASTPVPRNEELERQCAVLDFDNRALRDKLQDTQSRLSSLEAELTKLRPLLLLQPFSNLNTPSSHHAPSFLSSLPFPSLSHTHTRSRPSKRKVKESRSQHTTSTTPQVGEHDSTEAGSNRRSAYDVVPGTPADNSGHSESLLASTPTYSQHAAIPPAQTLTTPSTRTQLDSPRLRTSQSHTSFSPRPTLTPIHTRQGSNTLLSDARMEHLLLAARKLGRERTALVTGFIRRKHFSKGADLDKDRPTANLPTPATSITHPLTPSTPLPITHQQPQPMSSISYYRRESAVNSPRTPKRSSSHYSRPAQMSAQTCLSDPIVFAASSSAPPPPPLTLSTPARAGSLPNMPVPQSQTQQSSSTRRPGGGDALRISTQAPPTPLDSLLSAARSMMDDGTNEPQPGMPKRRASATQEPESPLPKRRRVSKLGSGSGGSLLERNKEKSALDVLADQAAAFGSSAEPPSEFGGRVSRSKKGKEKESDVRREDVRHTEDFDMDVDEDARQPASAGTAATTKHTESVANDQLGDGGDVITPARKGHQRQPRAKSTVSVRTRNKAPVSNIPTARPPQQRRRTSLASPQVQTTVESTSARISQPVDVVVAGTPLRESRRRNTLPASASGQQQQAEPSMSFGRKRGETWNNFSPEDIARSGSGSGSQTGQGTSRRTSTRARKSGVRARKGGAEVVTVRESATRSTVEEPQGFAEAAVGDDKLRLIGLETHVENEERASQNNEHSLRMASDAVPTTTLSSAEGDSRETAGSVVPDVIEIEQDIPNPRSFASGPLPVNQTSRGAPNPASSLSSSAPHSTSLKSQPDNATVAPSPLHDHSQSQEAPFSAAIPSGGTTQSPTAGTLPPVVSMNEQDRAPASSAQSAQSVLNEPVVHDETEAAGVALGDLPDDASLMEVREQMNQMDGVVMEVDADADAEGDADFDVHIEVGDDIDGPPRAVVYEANQARSRDEDDETDRDGEGDLDADAEGDEDLGLDGGMTPLQFGVEEVHPQIEPFLVGDEIFVLKRGASQGFLEGMSAQDQDPFFVHPNTQANGKES